jgi:hypothetical protein
MRNTSSTDKTRAVLESDCKNRRREKGKDAFSWRAAALPAARPED